VAAAPAGPTPALVAPAWFGGGVTPREAWAGWALQARTPAVVAFAPPEVLSWLLEQRPWLRLFVAPVETADVPYEAADPHLNLMKTPIRALVKRAPITLPPKTRSATRRS
jgi:CBS domain-containing protein